MKDTKENFDKLKGVLTEKIEMVGASRSNLLSHTLPYYQTEMLAYLDLSANHFHKLLTELRYIVIVYMYMYIHMYRCMYMYKYMYTICDVHLVYNHVHVQFVYVYVHKYTICDVHVHVHVHGDSMQY